MQPRLASSALPTGRFNEHTACLAPSSGSVSQTLWSPLSPVTLKRQWGWPQCRCQCHKKRHLGEQQLPQPRACHSLLHTSLLIKSPVTKPLQPFIASTPARRGLYLPMPVGWPQACSWLSRHCCMLSAAQGVDVYHSSSSLHSWAVLLHVSSQRWGQFNTSRAV